MTCWRLPGVMAVGPLAASPTDCSTPHAVTASFQPNGIGPGGEGEAPAEPPSPARRRLALPNRTSTTVPSQGFSNTKSAMAMAMIATITTTSPAKLSGRPSLGVVVGSKLRKRDVLRREDDRRAPIGAINVEVMDADLAVFGEA